MNKNNKYKIEPVIDVEDSYKIKKNKIWDIPFRLVICGKSAFSGKTNFIVNLLLKDEFYLNDFKGENIYIVSASLGTDQKLSLLVKVKDIPAENLMPIYDESDLESLYNEWEDKYKEDIENEIKPEQKLIIFDDISFKGDLKKHQNGIMSKIFCNGRHILVSSILTCQRYSDILTTCRENSSGLVIFSCSDRQLETIMNDVNILGNKKQFKNMYRDITNNPHSFLIVNYSNPYEELYLDTNFNKIDYNKYTHK